MVSIELLCFHLCKVKPVTQKDQLLLIAGLEYCRMLLREYSAIFLTCIKRLSIVKTNFWSSFEWLLKSGFTVSYLCLIL